LGSIVQDNGSSDLEIEKSISETRRVISMLNSILWSRNILHGTKLTVYNATVKSTLTYGAETWTVKQKHRNKLLATEMDYLRRSARISRMDKIRNEAIRTKNWNKDKHCTGNRTTKMVWPRQANGGRKNC
jgi:pullulanase/glycogen debranching enzyme